MARAQLRARIHSVAHLAPALMDGSGDDQNVLIRGNPNSPGSLCRGAFLEAIAGDDQPPIGLGSGRLQLAERMLVADNPLMTGGVIVNRLWHHLFGRGIVASVDNFGVLGERPSHPELLDYLAARLVDEGWSLKKMIRLMVDSQTYRMASNAADERAERIEEWRAAASHAASPAGRRSRGDAILAVSGSLGRTKVAGQAWPFTSLSFMGGRGRPAASGPLDGDGRRSLYIAVRRNFLPPLLSVFDMPAPVSTMGGRQCFQRARTSVGVDERSVRRGRGLPLGRTFVPHGRSILKQRIDRMYRAAFRAACHCPRAVGRAGLSGRASGRTPGRWSTRKPTTFAFGPICATACSTPKNSCSFIEGCHVSLWPVLRQRAIAVRRNAAGAVRTASAMWRWPRCWPTAASRAAGRCGTLAPARAKNVIFLYMDGGPSQVDTFDPKPRLNRDHGKPFAMKAEATQFNNNGMTLGSPWKFMLAAKAALR